LAWSQQMSMMKICCRICMADCMAQTSYMLHERLSILER
jgi:hypothetical protein